jgi:hypothetical protein
MDNVWVAGQITHVFTEGQAWDMQGIFLDEESAKAACRDHTYFIGPMKVGVSLPHETADAWIGAYFPLAAI